MKKLFGKMNASLLLVLFIYMTACSGEDEPVTPEIIPARSEMIFSKTGGSEILSVKSNVTLEVRSNEESWCRVAPAPSSSDAVYRYTVTADANSTTSDRSTTLTLKGGSVTQAVNVIQTAADGLLVTPIAFNDITGQGAQIEIKMTTNGMVTVTCNDDWITEVTARAAMTEQTRTFSVAANYGGARTGTITFTLGNLKETVTVTQLAGNIPNVGMESDAMTLAAKMYAGWNIGNTLEAIGGETAWGNPKITADYIVKIKQLGFNAIRIPCAWDQYIENAETYKIRESWLDRVNEVVGYCVANNMYAIVNIHWDGGWLENNCTPDKQEENNRKQHALWTQIANRLNHYDEHLLFAGTNEPNVDTAQKMTVLKSYLQTFIDAVRATGGNNAVRNLIVQGPNTDIDMTHNLFGNMPTDVVSNRLMAEVHYYNPWTFCGMDKDESWGRMAYFWGAFAVSGSDRNSTFGDEAEMKSLFGKMKTKFVDKGIPVILGEYGAITIRTGLGANQEAHDKSRNLYDETVTREAKDHGLVPFYWETGRVVNRSTGEIKDNYAMDGILKGAEAGKYPF
ncbi:MAG: glycosyl hydrolase family 5 [Bacteroidetes bacterium GWD2_45_23]|nr:MAG: glycosyl hydrolase family 5 [Bacteroidetes bacterium GWC2_46_850]OFX64709.1 MAG: glycosyl hydrolase family 5 [Bacteroidetes bacterium GWC1_47_7]OFX86315.1 MAG: glycosyl hydrolase family 5 [Bacteroidetes bacterium GWD2_45_23]HAR38032.1 glycosyl hydrolase family 5 [Porphyromonadaceae bacterium]HBA99708.1 glycosyl hydrolase family 5 [Porphyromonadaceae bacterium]